MSNSKTEKKAIREHMKRHPGMSYMAAMQDPLRVRGKPKAALGMPELAQPSDVSGD